MTNLTPEQRVLGRENADRALGGLRRRDLLKAVAATPALGAFYFGYKDMGNKSAVKAAIIGTGDEGCQAMIRSHNRAYMNFIGFWHSGQVGGERFLGMRHGALVGPTKRLNSAGPLVAALMPLSLDNWEPRSAIR